MLWKQGVSWFSRTRSPCRQSLENILVVSAKPSVLKIHYWFGKLSRKKFRLFFFFFLFFQSFSNKIGSKVFPHDTPAKATQQISPTATVHTAPGHKFRAEPTDLLRRPPARGGKQPHGLLSCHSHLCGDTASDRARWVPPVTPRPGDRALSPAEGLWGTRTHISAAAPHVKPAACPHRPSPTHPRAAGAARPPRARGQTPAGPAGKRFPSQLRRRERQDPPPAFARTPPPRTGRPPARRAASPLTARTRRPHTPLPR